MLKYLKNTSFQSVQQSLFLQRDRIIKAQTYQNSCIQKILKLPIVLPINFERKFHLLRHWLGEMKMGMGNFAGEKKFCIRKEIAKENRNKMLWICERQAG